MVETGRTARISISINPHIKAELMRLGPRKASKMVEKALRHYISWHHYTEFFDIFIKYKDRIVVCYKCGYNYPLKDGKCSICNTIPFLLKGE